jgi:hypothetical protein
MTTCLDVLLMSGLMSDLYLCVFYVFRSVYFYFYFLFVLPYGVNKDVYIYIYIYIYIINSQLTVKR